MVHRRLAAVIGALALGLGLVGGGGTAEAQRATPATVVWQRMESMLIGAPDDLKDARFAFDLTELHGDPVPAGTLTADFADGLESAPRTVAFSANGEAAWIAADLATYDICGDETCPKTPKPAARYHATALFTGGAPWQPVMWHLSYVFDGKEYAAAVAHDELDPVVDKVTKADDVVALFRTSMADPAALIKTVSSRADVVLYGTDRKERYVGGKKVAATLKKWSLAFTVRDGVQAGTTASGTVAWVAANVDAVSSKKPGAKPSPYRVTVLYEKTDAGWKAVVIHFSFQR